MIAFVFLVFTTATFAAPVQTIKQPQLLKAPVLALSPEERSRSSEEQVELAYTRATNLCNFLEIPKGEFSERRADFVSLSLLRPNLPVSLLAMTSFGDWKLLKVSFPGTIQSAVYAEVTCSGHL